MKWEKAKELILKKVKKGQKLDADFDYKIVIDVPRQSMFDNEKQAEQCYRVQVGKSSFVNISMDMLERLLSLSVAKGYIYNNIVFKEGYYQLSKNKPCYVHAVGGIFVKAGIAYKKGRNYVINH